MPAASLAFSGSAERAIARGPGLGGVWKCSRMCIRERTKSRTLLRLVGYLKPQAYDDDTSISDSPP